MVCCGLSMLSLHVSVFFPSLIQSAVECLCLFLFHYIRLHSCGDIVIYLCTGKSSDMMIVGHTSLYCFSYDQFHGRLDQHIQCKCIFQAVLYAGVFPHCVTKSQVHFMVLKMYDLATELIATTSRGGNRLSILPFLLISHCFQ